MNHVQNTQKNIPTLNGQIVLKKYYKTAFIMRLI